ncbi:hypothetical protein BD626DRAFT_576187 [Schizophyllum amplum]|uniref:Uncharacterized protein n=1 Tax=Schizophyllum amplum TaxID=97359 RepID=A0A550BU30_9AGAR|nr:hypothetical protein BD626DRAFT_576187 [Auriculariopsis ampla]
MSGNRKIGKGAYAIYKAIQNPTADDARALLTHEKAVYAHLAFEHGHSHAGKELADARMLLLAGHKDKGTRDEDRGLELPNAGVVGILPSSMPQGRADSEMGEHTNEMTSMPTATSEAPSMVMSPSSRVSGTPASKAFASLARNTTPKSPITVPAVESERVARTANTSANAAGHRQKKKALEAVETKKQVVRQGKRKAVDSASAAPTRGVEGCPACGWGPDTKTPADALERLKSELKDGFEKLDRYMERCTDAIERLDRLHAAVYKPEFTKADESDD